MNDEPALLKGAQKLEKTALTKIFDLYAPALYNYALRLCHEPIDSDNVVKDAFENLLEKLAAGQGPVTTLKVFLYQLAHQAVVDGAPQNHHHAPLERLMDIPDKLLKANVDEREMLTGSDIS